MKLDFQKAKNIFTTFSKIDPIFYKFYFKEIMEEWNVGLETFYNPQTHKRDQKNLKHDYLKKLFSSVKFKNDFFKILGSGQLEENYKEVIPSKLYTTLLKFDMYFVKKEGEERQTEVGLREFKKYFRNNKQCKLPWTKNELSVGIQEFIGAFGKDD